MVKTPLKSRYVEISITTGIENEYGEIGHERGIMPIYEFMTALTFHSNVHSKRFKEKR